MNEPQDERGLVEKRYGLENYLGSFQGKRTDSTYHLIQESNPLGNFEITAVFFEENDPFLSGGFLKVENVASEKGGPRLFLALPEVPNGTPIYYATIESAVEEDGIANFLFEYWMNRLKLTHCLDVVAFTEQGAEAMKHKYKNEGYLETETVDPQKVSGKYKNLSFWMYKQY